MADKEEPKDEVAQKRGQPKQDKQKSAEHYADLERQRRKEDGE